MITQSIALVYEAEETLADENTALDLYAFVLVDLYGIFRQYAGDELLD